MDDGERMATDRQQRLQETLDQVVAHPGVTGALLITRDGFSMMNRCPRLPAPETFAAMSATMLGAAEAALGELGDGKTPRVVVESDRRRIITVGATEELLLVTVTETSLRLDDVMPRLEAAAQTVAKLVAG